MTVLSAYHLTKTYKKRKHYYTALDDFSYDFENRKVYAIVGESGAGKTTLLSLLGSIETPTDGKVYLDGKSLYDLSNKELSLLRREKIGFVFQSSSLCRNLTATENVMLPLLARGESYSMAKKKAVQALENFGLVDRQQLLPAELSGGEQQRIAFARAVVNCPSIILADEPTGHLDKKNEEKIMANLCEFSNKGACIIVVTHNLHTLKYADEIIQLHSGKRVV